MTYVTWLKDGGEVTRVYDSLDFSWHETIPLSQTNVLTTGGAVSHALLLHKVDRTIPANAGTFEVSSLDPTDAVFYQRLVDAHAQIVNELTNSNLQTFQTGTVPGSPAESHYYRVIARALDSDQDDLSDLLEAGPAFPTSPYDSDTDSDAITDPWDRGDFSDVIISEFMATNDNALFDENGDDPDWIELFNPTNSTIDLSGWTLEDEDNLWTFPNAPTSASSEQLILEPGELLLVFASNKDRRNPSSELHTNFALSANGDRITLRKPAPNGGFLKVDEHDFEEQRKNTSGGWAFDPSDGSFPTSGGAAEIRYFVHASPGRTNPPSTCPRLSNAPEISPNGGLFPSGSGSLTVSISPPDALPSTLIYYSLDGSNPNEQSLLYSGPFQVSEAPWSARSHSRAAVTRRPSPRAVICSWIPSSGPLRLDRNPPTIKSLLKAGRPKPFPSPREKPTAKSLAILISPSTLVSSRLIDPRSSRNFSRIPSSPSPVQSGAFLASIREFTPTPA
jgi:hypothetical protein